MLLSFVRGVFLSFSDPRKDSATFCSPQSGTHLGKRFPQAPTEASVLCPQGTEGTLGRIYLVFLE